MNPIGKAAWLALGTAILLFGSAPWFSASAAGDDPASRGRYLTIVGGCNDCHTPGYLMSEGQTPESEWLTGDQFGWRGPWGTTYPANLRTLIATLEEDDWVVYARNLRARPPMPWFNLNHWKETDLRDFHAFVKQLGPSGGPAPAYVPPDQEPNPPYAVFPAPPGQ